MIQISNTTNMLLDMQGGFKTEERGGLEVKASFFSMQSLHRQGTFPPLILDKDVYCFIRKLPPTLNSPHEDFFHGLL